jgi:hypothetical protein
MNNNEEIYNADKLRRQKSHCLNKSSPNLHYNLFSQ